MSMHEDRLFNLLPAIYRQRDEERGWPLRTLLRVIGEQADIIEADIERLYDNWFIETCDDWVVPYIADLIGYEPIHPGDEAEDAPARQKIVVPRREVARTIPNRRRKGTLAMLDALSAEVAGWHSRSVEFYRRLGWTQSLNHQRPDRGKTLDLRDSHLLDLIGTPFDESAHLVDVRAGSFGIASVGLFVWRLNSYPVTKTQAYCIDERNASYLFSVLGNDLPLFTRPDHSTGGITAENEVPSPIRPRAFEVTDADGKHRHANPVYYGNGKALQIWAGDPEERVPPEKIIPADLSRWKYRPREGEVLVDPALGRIAFHRQPKGYVWVSYHYGFSADLGGGEYRRQIGGHPQAKLIRVGLDEINRSLSAALALAAKEEHAIVEIADSRSYRLHGEHSVIVLDDRRTLQIRAASGARPIIVVADDQSIRDSLNIQLGHRSKMVLDGLMVAGRSVFVHGPDSEEDPPDLIIRHCTLVPGWSLTAECHPRNGERASLKLEDTKVRVRIEHSILGSVTVNTDQKRFDALSLSISDSIVDATGNRFEEYGGDDRPCGQVHAISSDDCVIANAVLTLARCTILGDVRVHAIQLAADSIFYGSVEVARKQIGCVRFCYVPHGSRTPRRYHCQPDLVRAVPGANHLGEDMRVRPRFNSVRYGAPEYCQLACDCAPEISTGASDQAEMGALHDLYDSQRAGNLRRRLEEYVPASSEAGLIFAK